MWEEEHPLLTLAQGSSSFVVVLVLDQEADLILSSQVAGGYTPELRLLLSITQNKGGGREVIVCSLARSQIFFSRLVLFFLPIN